MTLYEFFGELAKIVGHDNPVYTLEQGEVRYDGLSVASYFMSKVHKNTEWTTAVSALRWLGFNRTTGNIILHCTPETLRLYTPTEHEDTSDEWYESAIGILQVQQAYESQR